MHSSSVRLAQHSIVPIHFTTTLGCFRIMKKLKLFLSHRNQSLIADFIITNGPPIGLSLNSSQILSPLFSNSTTVLLCLSLILNVKYPITHKELCYCPCIYLLLEWRYNLYACFAPWFDFQVI